MKIYALIAMVIFCTTISNFVSGQNTNLAAKAGVIVKNPDGTIIVNESAIVPVKNVYYFYDAQMVKLLATFREGQPVRITQWRRATHQTKDSPRMDCAQINCPPGFGANVVCWKCK